MCPSKLFIFDESGGISTQLSAIPKTRTKCADSVACGYHIYMDKQDPAIGDKFHAEIEVSNRHDRYVVNDPRCRNQRYKTKLEPRGMGVIKRKFRGKAQQSDFNCVIIIASQYPVASLVSNPFNSGNDKQWRNSQTTQANFRPKPSLAINIQKLEVINNVHSFEIV